MLVRAAKNGYTNEWAYYLHEYSERHALAKIGFTESLDDLDPFDANVFAIIASELENEKQRAIEKQMKKNKAGRR